MKKNLNKVNKRIKKECRHILRKVAQFILSFERCPIDNRKDYKGILFDAFLAVLVIFLWGVAFAGMFLIFN